MESHSQAACKLSEMSSPEVLHTQPVFTFKPFSCITRIHSFESSVRHFDISIQLVQSITTIRTATGKLQENAGQNICHHPNSRMQLSYRNHSWQKHLREQVTEVRWSNIYTVIKFDVEHGLWFPPQSSGFDLQEFSNLRASLLKNTGLPLPNSQRRNPGPRFLSRALLSLVFKDPRSQFSAPAEKGKTKKRPFRALVFPVRIASKVPSIAFILEHGMNSPHPLFFSLNANREP